MGTVNFTHSARTGLNAHRTLSLLVWNPHSVSEEIFTDCDLFSMNAPFDVGLEWEAMGGLPIAAELAQEFELLDSTRVPRRLSELISHGRLVLLFYRGNW